MYVEHVLNNEVTRIGLVDDAIQEMTLDEIVDALRSEYKEDLFNLRESLKELLAEAMVDRISGDEEGFMDLYNATHPLGYVGEHEEERVFIHESGYCDID